MRILLDNGLELLLWREGGAPGDFDPTEARRLLRSLLAGADHRWALRRLVTEARGAEIHPKWSDEEVLAEAARLLAAGRLILRLTRRIESAAAPSAGPGAAAPAAAPAASPAAASASPSTSSTSSSASAGAEPAAPPPEPPPDVPPAQAAAVAAALAQAAEDGAPLVETPGSAETTWIAVELVGEDDRPISGVRYQLTLPDGSVREGTLDAAGRVYLDGVDPGSCKLTFPDLDQEAWSKIGTADQP